MSDSLKKIGLEALRSAVRAAVSEVGDVLDAVLDQGAKQALADAAEDFKKRITRTYDENPPKKT